MKTEHQFSSRMQGSITDYHIAPGGEGPLATEWADKPHRLLYDLLGEIQALHASLERVEAEREWRPIETAPRDGTRVLIRYRGRWNSWHIADGHYDRVDGWTVAYATHWLPLPEPPSALIRSKDGETK
jgi:hypothetical protein